MIAAYGEGIFRGLYLGLLGILFGFATVRIFALWLYQEMEDITLGLLVLANLILATVAVLLQPMGIVFAVIAIILPYFLEALQDKGNRQLLIAIEDENEQRYKSMLETDPHNSSAGIALGDLYERQGRLKEAEAAYESALKLFPDWHLESKLNSVRRRLEEEAAPKTPVFRDELRQSLREFFSAKVMRYTAINTAIVLAILLIFELLLSLFMYPAARNGLRLAALVTVAVYYLWQKELLPGIIFYILVFGWVMMFIGLSI
ncbi:MAG: tetratricopeptide repeat protein [bacterium]|nr:tetratricopeptide repeat protein [bacterium]